MRVIRESSELEPLAGGAFVPTMGALHAGHLALVERAARLPGSTLVSIFVNPTQFGPDDDLGRYPRTLEADLEAAERAGADFTFVPDIQTIYPPDDEPAVPPLPDVATRPGLEDACRPGHFAGVCQVVARLFDLVRPAAAVFGEKDFQQLRVIEAMVGLETGRWPGLRIIPGPTVRAEDGLALSSRNSYLDHDQRFRALALPRALQRVSGATAPDEAEQAMRDELDASDVAIDYAVVRDARTLLPVGSFERPARALIAARVDRARLIDNVAI